VTEKISKKQIAREYFSSLDTAVPLRNRVDDLVEYMKIEFVNGQTERVVFNYVRDIIPEKELPKIGDDIFKNILKYKMDQRSNYLSPLCFDDDGPVARAIAVLMIIDFYAEKTVHHLGEWFYTNKIKIDELDPVFSIEKYSSSGSWISEYSLKDDLIRNHFPFHTKNQLESPVHREDILDIAKDYLGNDGIDVFNHAMSIKSDYKSALDYLETDYYWQLDGRNASAANGAEAQSGVSKKPFILFRVGQWLVAAFFCALALALLLDVSKLGIPGAPIVMFWGTLASLAGIAVAQSPPMFFRFSFKAKIGAYAGGLAAFFLLGIYVGQMRTAYEKTPNGIAEVKSRVHAAEAAAYAPSQRMPALDAKAICDSQMAAQADEIMNDCETEDCIKSKVRTAYTSCSSRMGY
jgi:hypothetical protein